MWFKNTQDANMRILRWRLKLAEYDYEVVYKAGKTNVNADALSRNPINLKEFDCKIIKKRTLNPNNSEDAQLIAEMLENSDTTLPFTSAELDEPDYLTITEKALIHNPYEPNKIQTRSQTKRENWEQNKIADKPYDNEEEIQEIIKENDPSDKISEDGEENEEDIINQNLKARKVKPAIIENRITKSNIIDSRELLFLRKDNVAYFVDTQGKPLDSGSQKLFERNGLPNMGSLVLGDTKAIKYKNHYHMALPISEAQREGPTVTLNHIIALRKCVILQKIYN
ncbi:hypothetical protein ACFW04_014483 [Cataglyphis niger]